MPEPDLFTYGLDPDRSREWEDWASSTEASEVEGPRLGRVVRHDGAGLMVATGDDAPVRAMFGRAITPRPVVGDWIVIDRTPHPVATLERRSLLRRRAAGGEGEQALVANVDLVLIVCGLDRPVRLGRIQRTLTLAHDAGADALVVLTKGDLAEPGAVEDARRTAAEADPDLATIVLSAADGRGVDELLDHMGKRTVALIGESGAGKSTLVNTLLDREVAAEGAVRTGDHKGRHTTTSRELHPLPTGAILVDTPGIREVGIFAESEAVAETFPDVEEVVSTCRFSDCSHVSEPGCAVRVALEEGSLDPDRFARWSDLEEEASIAAALQDPSPYRRRLATEAARRRAAARRYGSGPG